MRDLAPILTEHSYELRAAGKAERSIDNRTYNVRLFTDWLAGLDDAPEAVAEVTTAQVTRWLAERADVDAAETLLTRYRHLRAFFRWAEREEIVARSPLTNLREPRAETQPVPVLSTDDLRRLFATTRKDTSFLGRRDFAMLAFLADTGVRVGELVALEVEDLDFGKAGTAHVVGKFRRERTVAFGPKVGKALLAYLRERSRHRLAEDARLWIGQRGPLRAAAVWQVVRARGEDAGIKNLHPHVMRHTFAHRFRSEGGEEGDLAQLGGWRSPAMLARYGASAAAERALEAHQRVDLLGDVL
ncbi:MAG: tyrosine-type recombinase/integrase [Acidimicrobiia bacterium]